MSGNYIFDANGSPVGFRYRGVDYASGTWDTYGFEKNLQGDIVAVYNVSTGTKLISYRYNAWGVCSTTYHNSGSTTTATKNPFKYRGYYYDSNLGLYYLQSRYYDQNTCRFINADGYVSTGQGLAGYNMFAYCGNNPVMYRDDFGKAPFHVMVSFRDGGCSESKSISERLNLYDSTGSRVEGMINVKFSPNSKNPSFQIENSAYITNEYEQRLILYYIMTSSYYSQEIYGRTLESMLVEWKAHNEYYYSDYSSIIDKVFSLNTRNQAKSVDFDYESEGLEEHEYMIDAGIKLAKRKVKEKWQNFTDWLSEYLYVLSY